MSVYVGFKIGEAKERRAYISEYYCGGCGWPVSDYDSYCPECGGAFSEKDATERTCKDASTDCDIWQCSECGIQFDNPSYFPTLWDGSKVAAPRFCPGCGARVVE